MGGEDINFAGIVASVTNFEYMKAFDFLHSSSNCHCANGNWYQSQDTYSPNIFHSFNGKGSSMHVFAKVNVRRILIIPVSERVVSFLPQTNCILHIYKYLMQYVHFHLNIHKNNPHRQKFEF